MTDDQQIVRHNVYLTDSVWRAFRQRAFLERRNANELAAYLLKDFLENPQKLPEHRYKERVPDREEDPVKGRTIRVPAALSARVQAVIQGKISFASLVDLLLRRYLVIELAGETPAGETPEHDSTFRYDQPTRRKGRKKVLQIGETKFDLGDDPFELDLGKGDEKT